MNEKLIEVYVVLLEEGTDTIRPTEAISLGAGVCKLLPTENYDPEDEVWEFPPGSTVRCVPTKTDKNEPILIALERVYSSNTSAS